MSASVNVRFINCDNPDLMLCLSLDKISVENRADEIKSVAGGDPTTSEYKDAACDLAYDAMKSALLRITEWELDSVEVK